MSIFDNELNNVKKLLDELGREHIKYLDALTLFEQLKENISVSQLYGDTADLAARRNQIRRELNRISLEVFKRTVDQLVGDSSTDAPLPASSASRPATPVNPRIVGNKNGKLVFISHSSKDDGFVAKLAHDLTEAGLRVWHDDQDIKVPDSIPGKINIGLTGCHYFLFVLTPDSVTSHWVLQEVDAALAAKKVIVPVLLKDCERPALIQANKYADFRTDYKSGLKALLDGLGVKQTAKSSLGLSSLSSKDRERQQIQLLKSFAGAIEHKFQRRRAYDISPKFLDQILANLHTLNNITNEHGLRNKISRLEIQITAAIRYYLDNKYEEYLQRLGTIRDQLYDLDD